MTIRNIKRILSLVVSVMMVLQAMGIMTASAEDTYRADDFESYAEGFTAFNQAGYAEFRNAEVVSDNGNNCLKVTNNGKLFFDNRNFDENTDVYVSSVSFKIKDSNADGDVLGFAGAHSQWAKVYVRLVGTDLYFDTAPSQTVSEANKIYSGLEVDKWYNVYVVIDRTAMTRSVYLSGEKIYSSTYRHGKDGGEQDYRRRLLLVSNSGTIYFDNVEMYEFEYDEYKNELIRLKSIVNTETNIGYEDGKYPESAVNMFKDAIVDVTDIDGLNEAFSVLESRKIDTSSTDETAAFIETDVPVSVTVDAGEEAIVTLDATAKTVALNDTGAEVAWEITETDSEGVTLSGNELVISDTAKSGTVKLRAYYDDIYTYAKVKVNVVTPLPFIDFESYEEGYESFGSDGYREVKNVKVVKENDNKFISIEKNEYNSGNIIKEDTTLDSSVMVTSVDFMVKDTETEATIIGFTGSLSQYGKVNLRVKGKNLYFNGRMNDELTEVDKIYSDLELGKWYSVYLVIDRDTMTRSIYLGGEQIYSSKYTHGKDGGELDYTRRWIGLTKAGTLYVDNLGIFELTDSAFDLARLNANSMMNTETNIGYEDGKYPQGAVDMLRNDYKTVGDLDSIKGAIEEFKARKIDLSSDSSETAFVKIDTQASAGVVADSTNYIELQAEAAAVNMSGTGDEVIWEIIESTIPGASVIGNTLELPISDEDGSVMLKASSGDVYAYLPLKVNVMRDAEITEFTAENGKIEVQGTINKNINLGAVLKAEGATISASTPLEINKDLTFTASIDIGTDTVWQDVTLTIEGDELNTFTKDVVFYGVGWEEGIKEVINNCSDTQQTAGALKKYSLGLEIDEELIEKHSSVYAERIAAAKPYGDFATLTAKVKEIQFVVAFYETVRSDYEAFIEGNIAYVTEKGLDTEKLHGLNDADSYQFYAELSKIDIDLSEDTPESICDEMNTILDKVTVPEEPSKPIGGGSSSSGRPSGGGGGGGFSGGSSTTKEDEFKVELVPDDTKEETEQPAQTVQFADVKDGYWAADALLYMRANNIMVGDGTSVRPEDKLTRGEFVKILVTAFNLPETDGKTQFADSDGKWWAEYAQIAADMGIINGVGDGNFGGDAPVTRQMMAVMIDRLITARGITLYDQTEEVKFTDYDLIDSYATEAVTRLGKKGIVSGIGDGLFAPFLTVKRAEAAQIIYNILKQL